MSCMPKLIVTNESTIEYYVCKSNIFPLSENHPPRETIRPERRRDIFETYIAPRLQAALSTLDRVTFAKARLLAQPGNRGWIVAHRDHGIIECENAVFLMQYNHDRAADTVYCDQLMLVRRDSDIGNGPDSTYIRVPDPVRAQAQRRGRDEKRYATELLLDAAQRKDEANAPLARRPLQSPASAGSRRPGLVSRGGAPEQTRNG